MKIYIAGPMTGYKNFNREKFLETARNIKAMGHEPIHTADMPDGLSYEDYMLESLNRLEDCDAIYLLKGWTKSNGANEEFIRARELGLEIFYEREGLLCLLKL